MDELPPYPSGLRLAGRRVIVVGGGHVAQRRIPALLACGADVVVVSPAVTPAIEGMLAELTWIQRPFEPADLDEAWYVVAATASPDVNAAVSAAAEQRRIFCVRSDDGLGGSAWTPASGRHEGLTISVLGNREPRRTTAVRDGILAALHDGRLDAQTPTEAGVVLVGGGPGDPDLVTVAGRKALINADVVVADRLAPRELIADLPAHVELIDVAKLPRGRSAQQEEINRVIVERALAGKRVVRFKGGDSFVFGRGYEEIIACREAGVPVTVIPGITSPISVPAVAGIPVTHRGVAHEFTVISGHLPPGHPGSLTNWTAVAGLGGTLVVLMGVENAAAIATALLDGGRDADTPVGIVCDGTMATQRTLLTTLGELGATVKDVSPPAIIVIGEVVRVAHPEAF